MKTLLNFKKATFLFVYFMMCRQSFAQKFVENVDYFPEFNLKAITIINLTDTVKILYVTDSTLVAFTGREAYDTLTLKDHLKSYRLDHLTSFYQRQKGKIVAKTLAGGAILGLTGGLIGVAVSGGDTWDEVDGFANGFVVGSLFGAGVGLISGLANFQKYDWRQGDSIGLKIKKIKKYQACSYILPYHLKSATVNLVAQ
jgi:hypothetical protein